MSHACILARTMGVPAVTRVGERLFTLREGGVVVVNGFTGEVFADPDERTLMAVREGARAARTVGLTVQGSKFPLAFFRGYDMIGAYS